MATAAQQAVLDAYANIGRSGFGDSVANVDQEGYNYWVSQLESGAVTTDQLNDAFGNAVQEYIEDNPDDEYTNHVVNAIVEREYERIGRTGSGDDVSNIDEEGKQYWADQVRQGNVAFNDLDDAFDNAVVDYLQDNPDDEYSQYIASQRPDLVESAGVTVPEKPADGAYTPEEQTRYDLLNSKYQRLFGRPIGQEGADYWIRGEGSGVVITDDVLVRAAQGSDLDYYNTYVKPPEEEEEEQDTTTGPRESTAGSVVPGAPQIGETGVVEYMGLQAGEPTLPAGTQLAPRLESLEATDETLQALTPETTLETADQYVATPQEITATTVSSPTPQDAVTGTVTTTDLVEQPEAAQMTAEKSFEQISAEADALQAARQDLNTIDPRATVQGQLASLQEQFADGEIPVWASGAFRTVNSLMAQRGIGGSTIAAEAITNALMQSALPIAQQDASFYQNVTIQNLSNEQQAEMAKFNARTTAIFNDQAAENAARSLNTQSTNDLTRFFAELSQNVALTNTAQTNAMEQFNATAQNQMTQFFEELGLTAETFNADQVNELAVFDAEQANIISQFNASMKDQRERFNVQNQLAIDASNVQWRRDINTANTSATNAALQFDAQNLLGIQQTALNNIWQHYDTLLNYMFQSEESAANRANQLVISSMNAELQRQIAEESADSDLISGIFKAGATLLGSDTGNTIVKKYLGINTSSSSGK